MAKQDFVPRTDGAFLTDNILDKFRANHLTRLAFVLGILLIAMSTPIMAVEPTKKKIPEPPAYVPLLDAALRGPMAGIEDIVFAVRKSAGGHFYENFGHSSKKGELRKNGEIQGYGNVSIGDQYGGGGLCRLNLRTKQMTVLLKVVTGRVRDPQVHYDGKTILFSYRKDGSEFFNLYEINADGTGLRQLTDGPFDDIEPTYLPDGNIIFISSRCKRFVPCWWTQVATLHRCDGAGGNIRPLTSNVEHENTPWMLPDGRVIYMRWEYVDRAQTKFHHLWTMNPDGTGQMVYYGNMHPGIAMLDAKPIPGSDKVVASFSGGFGGHGVAEHNGSITIVDPKAGPDDKSRAQRIRSNAGGDPYRDPYPFSDDCFLVCGGTQILLMNGRGDADLIYDNPDGIDVHEPRPLISRPREPVLADRVDMGKETGTIVLSDILHGRNMAGVQPGEIRKLLVLESLPKPVNLSMWMEPISLMSTFTLSRILGTIPVEADGSAYAEIPAMRSLFFVALDENNMSVKRMQSFFTVQPGETVGCAGCHEKRTDAPRMGPMSMALTKKAAKLEPIRDVPEILDYPRDIQPILNRNCLPCHNQEKHEGDVILSDELLAMDRIGKFRNCFTRSYGLLMDPKRNLIAHGQNKNGNRPPRSIGTSASRLLKLLDGSHEKVKVSDLERRTIMLWIESGAPYAGTYGSLGKSATRFDAASGFRPTWQYMLEMKRYGILPESFDIAKDPIDCYAVDQAYWRSFWYPEPATNPTREDRQ